MLRCDLDNPRYYKVKRNWLEDKLSDVHAKQKAEEFKEELDQLIESSLENKDAEKLRKRLTNFVESVQGFSVQSSGKSERRGSRASS